MSFYFPKSRVTNLTISLGGCPTAYSFHPAVDWPEIPQIHVEILTPHVTVFEDGVYKEVIKVT